MANLHTAPIGVKGKISYFFRQTFRRHSGAEYSELLTRGMRGVKGVNRKYPWAYLRLFALLFILLAVYILVVRFTSNGLYEPTITAVAGICFNLPFLVLIYELYPHRDLTLMTVFLAALLGGAGSHVAAQILFNIIPAPNAWLKAVMSGFFEELPKAVATVLVILGARRRSPLAGFVLGAAVGCGFSIVEDMGDIFTLSNQLPVMNLTSIITISLTRGLTAFCTHILWSAAIGWVYSLYNKWLASVSFWLVTLLSCGLHICWDLPLNNLAGGFVCAGCVIVIAVECILILVKERKRVFDPKPKEAPQPASEEVAVGEQLSFSDNVLPEVVPHEGLPDNPKPETPYYFDEDSKSMNASSYKYWRHWGHLCCMVGAFLMAVVGIIYCAIPFQETYGTKSFKNAEAFVSFMQDGHEIDAEEVGNRTYNPGVDGSEFNPLDEFTLAGNRLQYVEDNGYTFVYEYYAEYDYVMHRNYFMLVSVNVVIDGVSHMKEDVYYQGELYASFFRLTKSEVTGINISATDRTEDVRERNVTVFVYDPTFVRDLTDWEYASFFIALGVIAAASSICAVSFKLKSWRVKKLCQSKTASSAK